MYKISCVLSFIFFFETQLLAQPAIIVGDPGWSLDESKLDTNYPDMREWSKAGVRGGIPYSTIISKTLSPIDDLQAAIDEAARKGGGILLLSKGTYTISQELSLKTNVVLRGENKNETILQCTLRSKFINDELNTAAIKVVDCKKAGIENLTLEYKPVVDFEPIDYKEYTAPWDEKVFKNFDDKDLFVSLVYMANSEDCWLSNSNFFKAGTDPIHITNSHYITCRGNFVDRCYNKGDNGNGYYAIRNNSSHVLLYKERIKRIRHLAIERGAKYNVVYDCDLEVDINFHNGDDGHNLIEKCRIRIPNWHGWKVFAVGSSSNGHFPPGSGNVLFNNLTDNKSQGPLFAKPNVIYEMVTAFAGDDLPSRALGSAIETKKPAPRGGTFYAVKNMESPITYKADVILPFEAQLGEGAFWHHKSNLLYWVDIEGGKLHLFNPANKTNKTIDVKQKIGTVVPFENDNSKAIVALKDGIYIVNIENQQLVPFASPEKDLPNNRFNDGKCDPAGRLWAGTMSMKDEKKAGSLYCIKPDGSFEKKLDQVSISNGIVWSADKKTMYHIDTPTGETKTYTYDDKTEAIQFEKIAVTVPGTMGHPDGMAIDKEGMLWIALWGGYAVTRWDPATGKLLAKVEVPAPNVTSCAFGGKDLDTLYITTARVGLNPTLLAAYPQSGSLFAIKTGHKGVKTALFRGQ